MFTYFSSLRKSALFLSAIVSLGVLLAACSKNADIVETPVARIMAFNLVPDQDGIGIDLSGNRLLNNPLSYTSFTGGYLNIFPGQRLVESYSFPQGNGMDSTSFTFEQDQYYSLFVVGADSVYKNVLVWDNYDSLSPAAGKAFVRYIHAVPQTGESVVTFTGNGSDHQETAAYATVSDFRPINAGDFSIALENEGLNRVSRSITVEENRAYTILFTGLPNATDTSQSVQIRYILNGTITE